VRPSADISNRFGGGPTACEARLDRVSSAIHRLRTRLPFARREWHSDNCSEFLNTHVLGWCRREGIRFTRGRPYRKNDQAWVEQRNWLAVRRLIGYDRYNSRPALVTLQRLYDLLRLQLNFFRLPTRPHEVWIKAAQNPALAVIIGSTFPVAHTAAVT
jgi:transposase InsO family protein